ncbi:MAG: MFS transporter [Candidatus Hermodarchaeia archaeon]|jgi:MFS family permease
MFTSFLWFPYRSLFILELGATKELLGILLMLETLGQIIFQLTGGILADRFGRRRVIVYSSFFRIASPIIFLFSTHWTHIAPGLILNSVAMLGIPATNALIAESLPVKSRGAGYATYRMVTWMPMIVTSLLGGILMDYYGIIKGVQLCLIASLIVSIVSAFLRWKFITETLETTVIKPENVRAQQLSFKDRLVQQLEIIPRSVWILILVSSLSGFAMRSVFSFMVVYSVEIVGLTKTEWGVIGTVVSLISTVLTIPAGMLTDRIGRKPCIMISRILSPLSTLGFTFATNFWQLGAVRVVGGVAQGFGGLVWGAMGGPAWQALVADVTPSKSRGKIMGMMGAITGVASTPASWVGGYMYDNISPNLPFQTSFILDIVGTVIFMAFLKEPKSQNSHGLLALRSK